MAEKQSMQSDKKPENSLKDCQGIFSIEFNTLAMEISRLLSEAWLDIGKGREFKEALKTKSVKQALIECGINVQYDDSLQFMLDTSTYKGSIVMPELLHQGLTFLWQLPYAPRPQNGITEAEIGYWISEVDNWLKNPTTTTPEPPNIYIPLATS